MNKMRDDVFSDTISYRRLYNDSIFSLTLAFKEIVLEQKIVY